MTVVAVGELRVRLFGGLEVEGVSVRDLGSRKARTLVKLLTLGRSAPVSADRIIDALWSDDPPARPLEQVGVLVSRLRPTLGAERIRRTDAGWCMAVDWFDLIELEARVDETAARLEAGSHVAALAAATAALALVRGEFLADEPDARWADTDRTAAERVVARARVLTAEAALVTGRPADAAAAADNALDHDPYDEAALRVLMRAHAAAGRPASALAAYARVRERLSEDLGVDPVDETEALHTAVLLGQVSAIRRTEVPTRDMSIVGRADELDRLDRALADASAGQAAAVVVEGEAGIGKTALLDVWIPRARSTALVLTGRCDELGRDLPLQPLLDGLAAHLRELTSEESMVVLADAAPLLGPLLGRLPAARDVTEPTTVVDHAVGQAALFANLLAVIERSAGDRAAVVVVEDIHLAGASTLEWLQFAVRRGARLMVLASKRPGEGLMLAGADVLSLGPLHVEAVAQLVGDDRAGELYSRSGGHPLFLVELAAADSSELPTSVRDAVAARMDGLGETAATLRAAAVLGSDVDIDALAGVVGLTVPELLEHMDTGVRERIIEERGGVLAFRHELVREALVADTTAARRAYIHREAARVLRDRPGHDPLEVAWHAQRGGAFEDAAATLIDAAAIASDRYDTLAAEDLLGRAIGLHDTTRARIARARARIARWDMDGAREDARHALDHGGGAEALEVAAWVEYYRRDYDLAFRYAEEAVERSDDDGLRSSCLGMTGRVLHAKGDLDGGDERLTEATAAAPPSVRGFTRVWLAGVRMHQGRPDEAIELVDLAMMQPSWLGHPFARHHGQMFRVLALGQRGRLTEALASTEAGRAASLESGEQGQRFVIVADNVRSWLLRSVGRLSEADDLSVQSCELGAAYGPSTNEMRCAAMLDLIDGRLFAGDLDGAVGAVERAVEIETFRGTMAWHHRERYGVQRARLALLAGDRDTALELASGVEADARARGSRRYEVLAHAHVALAQAALGMKLDHDELELALAPVDECAVLEGWWITAELAAATREDRWWRAAERRAGALISNAGEHADSLQQWVASRFSVLGRR
jgi:DNA-binding SARP family transcriptional activator